MLDSLLVLAAAVCFPVLLYLCIPRLRRSRADSRPAVFELAYTAGTERIRRQAQELVIAFGEELQDAPPNGDALDAYQAATMVLDAAASLADLAGVLVLVNIGAVAARCVCSTRCTARRPGRLPGGSSAPESSFRCPFAVPARKRSADTGHRKSCRIS